METYQIILKKDKPNSFEFRLEGVCTNKVYFDTYTDLIKGINNILKANKYLKTQENKIKRRAN